MPDRAEQVGRHMPDKAEQVAVDGEGEGMEGGVVLVVVAGDGVVVVVAQVGGQIRHLHMPGRAEQVAGAG